MSTIYNDDITFEKDVTLTNAAVIKYATKAFTRDAIMGGSIVFETGIDLPENVLILGAFVTITTPLTYSAGTTTGVTAKIGTSGDDDGFGLAVAIGGAAGVKAPEPGARRGVLNTTDYPLVAFTATGGTPNLSQVSAGAGFVTIAYAPIPA